MIGSRKRPPSEGCNHIEGAMNGPEAAEFKKSYSLAIKLLFARTKDATDRRVVLKCQTCGDLEVLLCLKCSFAGCVKHFRDVHLNKKAGHNLAVDLSSQEGLPYCVQCQDYVENKDLEDIKHKRLKMLLLRGESEGYTNGIISKIEDVGVAPSFQATTGLRGFYNMGSTCFISVILQSLIHNPFLRNFFLAGGHDSGSCTHKEGANCIGCCVDRIFHYFYSSSDVSSFGITELLTSSWSVQRSLSGSTEQDAHEFFQFLLQELHESNFKSPVFEQLEREVGDDNGSKMENGSVTGHHSDSSCQCISHKTFYGQLESRIKCLSCKTITTTVDPVMDLSLEIRSKAKKVQGAVTLEDCLDRFTSVERLDTNYQCSSCNQKRLVEKQLLVKRLPPVLSIQVKRFEHHHYGPSTKIETKVSFPLFLDMAKYTVDGPGRPLRYELFGVICHQGSLNTGHYTCMIKTRLGSWFHFDDSMITKVSTTRVLAANAYLLFYIIHECPI